MKLSRSSVERVVSSFGDLDLGDPRRTERARTTVAKFAVQPGATLPSAMGSEADIEGAYRFMNSRHVSMEQLNNAHAGATAAERGRAPE